jgi:hypothetical protein
MTTSGTYSYNANRDQIIRMALRKIGAFEAGETPDNQAVQYGAQKHNMMVKSIEATGLHIWTETEATVFLQPGQISYTLGTGSTDHATESYVATTLSADAALSATTINVESATGFGDGYQVGLLLSTGYLFWTTQVGAASGTTITIADALTEELATGTVVYAYATNIVRPLRVVSARRYDFVSGLITPLILYSRIDYRNLPNPNDSGIPNVVFYDPRGGANTQGILWIWPTATNPGQGIKMTWWRPVQDFNSAANTPDLPQEWLDCLVWNLAYKMAPEYDCPSNRYAMIKEQAAAALDLTMGFDREPESYLFGYNTDQTGP